MLSGYDPSGVKVDAKIVNTAATIDDLEVRSAWDDAIKLVVDTHGDGLLKPLTVLPMGYNESLDNDATYRAILGAGNNIDFIAAEIRLAKRNRLTMKRGALEELAHHLDLFAFRVNDKQGSGQGILASLVDGLLDTQTVRSILASSLDNFEKDYLTLRHEVFARFYIQFIAEERRDAELIEHIQVYNRSLNEFRTHQFRDASEIIEQKKLFVQILLQKGWLRDKALPLTQIEL
jgi:hypothetical protein